MIEEGETNVNWYHIVFFVHGNHGTRKDLQPIISAYLNDLRNREADKRLFYFFFASRVNERMKTHDGLKVCGSKLVHEVSMVMDRVILPFISAQMNQEVLGIDLNEMVDVDSNTMNINFDASQFDEFDHRCTFLFD